MTRDYAVDAETHERVCDALCIATSKLDAAERVLKQVRDLKMYQPVGCSQFRRHLRQAIEAAEALL